MRPSATRLATTRPMTWKAGLATLVISILWSGNIVSIKIGLATVPPFWSAFWRMLVAAIAVAAWARLTGNQVLFSRRDLRDMLGLSAMFTAQIAVFNVGVHYTSPAYAVVLLNTCPVIINFISHFFVEDDRLTAARLLGLCIAFAGSSYVVFGQPSVELAPNAVLGNSLMLVSALLLAIRIVYTQHLVQRMDTLRPVIWQMFLSLPAFLVLAAWLEPPLLQPLGLEAALAILYQALVVAGFCFVAWTALLQRHSAGNLSVYSFSVPFFGILLSALFFREAVTWRLLGGAVAVSTGIITVMRSRQQKARDEK